MILKKKIPASSCRKKNCVRHECNRKLMGKKGKKYPAHQIAIINTLAIKLIFFSSTIAFLAFQMLLFTEERIYFEMVIDVGAQNQRLGSHILNFQLKSGVLAGSVLCTVVLQTSVCAIVA